MAFGLMPNLCKQVHVSPVLSREKSVQGCQLAAPADNPGMLFLQVHGCTLEFSRPRHSCGVKAPQQLMCSSCMSCSPGGSQMQQQYIGCTDLLAEGTQRSTRWPLKDSKGESISAAYQSPDQAVEALRFGIQPDGQPGHGSHPQQPDRPTAPSSIRWWGVLRLSCNFNSYWTQPAPRKSHRNDIVTRTARFPWFCS
jgi:hypothetical protein